MLALRAALFWLVAPSSPASALHVDFQLRGGRSSMSRNRSSRGWSKCPRGQLPATNCPNDDVWLDQMLQTDDLSVGKVFIDVGCNKATSLVRLMERYDYSGKISSQAVKNVWARQNVGFACPELVAPAVTVQSLNKTLPTTKHKQETAPPPLGVCVEPMQSTVNELRSLSKSIGLNEEVNFHLVQAAVVKSAIPGQTLSFPDGTPGTEDLGIGMDAPSSRTVDVPAVTVDGLASQVGLGLADPNTKVKVDVLHIDVEGSDPDVLAGAQKTLQVTRYVSFEVHRDLEDTTWSHTTLRSVIDSMSKADFECYWTTNEGHLYSVEGCWDESFEHTGWSNVACVKRSDPWASVLARLSG